MRDHRHFDGVEIVATRYAFTMERCARCGEFRGLKEGSTVLCLCDGLRCKRCGKRNIWRPISDYYDEKKGGFWHVLHFAERSWCYACETARDEARRIFKQERPWGDE